MGEFIGIGEYATRVLKEEGIECGFGVTGMHAEMFIAMFPQYGMKLFNGRHEQFGPYACDGYAGASRKTAICWGTAGPGVTNMTSGIAQAQQNYRPLIALCGQHGPIAGGHWSIQEAYPMEIMKSICKMAVKLESSESVGYWLRRACKVAREYPPGPVVLVMSPTVMGWPMDTDQYYYTWPRNEVAYPSSSFGDPKTVEKVVQMILNAERPLMFVGDGLYWSHGEEELSEFVELTQTPVCCRRASRGSVPEDSALAVPPGIRGQIQRAVDLNIFIGMRETTTEDQYLAAPLGSWSHESPFIQINEAGCDLIDFLPTPLSILGNPKNVLSQMVECARDLLKVKKPDRDKWLNVVAECKENFIGKLADEARECWEQSPIGGGAWKQACREFIEDYPETTVVLDSFSGSHWTSNGYTCRFPGQSLDAGGWSGVGHGVAMGFGIQVAKPGKPVLVMMGDGGMGIGGMEIETCARYGMPVVSVVWNNSQWMAPLHEWVYKYMASDNKMQKDIRYDNMFGVLDNVHSEYCTKPEELRPALERSFNSGKTAVVNMIVSPLAYHPMVLSVPAHYARWFGLERVRELLPPEPFEIIEEEWKHAGGVQGFVDIIAKHTKIHGV